MIPFIHQQDHRAERPDADRKLENMTATEFKAKLIAKFDEQAVRPGAGAMIAKVRAALEAKPISFFANLEKTERPDTFGLRAACNIIASELR